MALRFYRVIPNCLATVLLGSGCVAFNVGREKTFTHVDRHVETAAEPSKVEVVSAEAQLKTLGNEVVVSLGADVKEEFEKRAWEETVTVRQRKRLAVGLFPGAAEFMLMPKGALRPAILNDFPTGAYGNPPRHAYYGDPRSQGGKFVLVELGGGILSCGLVPLVGTLCSLPPFILSADWGCNHHDFFDPAHVQRIADKNGKACYDVSGSPKLRSLLKFSKEDRKRIGVNTCFYSARDADVAGEPFSHMGLVGFHKYLAVFVDDPVRGAATVCGAETKRRSAEATGPFIAELSIPVLGHNDWKRIPTRESRATFMLPPVERDLTVEAIVSFREDDGTYGRREVNGVTKQAVAKAVGRQWRVDITVKGTGRRDAARDAVQVPRVVPAQPEAPYRIGDVRRGDDGKYTVRVDVLDQSETFAIHRRVRPDVQRMILEDYAGRNPDVPARDIRHIITMETDKDGKALFYTGWAFAVKPAENGWSYDPNTRRGWVRVRIVGSLSADAARRWARENIEAIIADKNVVVAAGEAPPPGATYRSLGEKFENDILTVEFEALQ